MSVDLDDAAEIHHGDPVADMLDHREIVRDEQIGQPELVLQVHQQVDDLRLDRHVERRDRLVADDQIRARAPSARAMPMRWRCPPENSCGYELISSWPQAHALEQRSDALPALAADRAVPWMISGSPTISPAVMRGLSEA